MLAPSEAAMRCSVLSEGAVRPFSSLDRKLTVHPHSSARSASVFPSRLRMSRMMRPVSLGSLWLSIFPHRETCDKVHDAEHNDAVCDCRARRNADERERVGAELAR